MNYTRLESQIMNDEGFRARPYLDTEGIPTIGYGSTTVLGVPVQMTDSAISADNARKLLRSDLYGALTDAQALFTRFNEMDSVRQEALANMAYNLGRHRLGGFRDLIAAAQGLDFPAMAEAAQDSKWYRQVGKRGERIVQALRTGDV